MATKPEIDPCQFSDDMDALAREDFYFFVLRAFDELSDSPLQDNWHIHAITHCLTRAVKGKDRRLIITMPPRSLKSFIGSVCLPAWQLGRNPALRVVCVSYAQHLAEEFAFQTRKLMQSDWYKQVFPGTRLDPKKTNAKVLATTRGGQRRTTSVDGALTGLGGDFVILDDPMKAADAHSEAAREKLLSWYRSTVTSRLDDPKKGVIVVIAQRLHMEDLPGYLLEQGFWQHLDLPLVEWKDREIELAPDRILTRPAGHILHEERLGKDEIAQLRAEMGERDFEAQYNQRPLPPGGALFKGEWLKYYDELPPAHQIQGIFQSWDTAFDIEEQHDYSVCTTWALSGKKCYLIDVFRAKLEFYALEKAIYDQRKKWKADLVIVEKAGSGLSLYQNIRNDNPRRHFWLQYKRPEGSKQDRASKQTPKFERGEIFLRREAEWLPAFRDELLSFPHGKHDDQVDSAVQFLAALDTGNLVQAADFARRH